jgi:hypothetical protein
METKVKKKPRFKINESGYHKSAKDILASWVNGKTEQKFCVDGKTVFVADVAVYKDGKLDFVYEVVHTHPMTGKKYGMIQFYCYSTISQITVFEVSSHFILSQTSNPEVIEAIEKYVVGPFEYEGIDECLIKSVS